MQMSDLGFIIKVLVLSTGLGVAIKYLAPVLPLSPSLGLAIAFLVGPSALMAGLLWLQSAPKPPAS
jgi:hypothetical protein